MTLSARTSVLPLPDRSRSFPLQDPEAPPLQLDGIEIRPVMMTPWLAKRLLELNTNNRKQAPRNIATLARDMKAEHYLFTGETVVIDREDELVEGQHRLEAVVTSGVSVPMILVLGVDPLVRDATGTGRPRNFLDVLRARGEANVNQLATAVQTCCLYLSGDLVESNIRLSVQERLYFLNRNPCIRDSTRIMTPIAASFGWPVSSAAAWHFLATRKWTDETAAFLEELRYGQATAKTSPVYNFRMWLYRHLDDERSYKPKPVEYLALVITRFNEFVEGRRASEYTWARGDELPTVLKRQ